jgi:hypothetical protein
MPRTNTDHDDFHYLPDGDTLDLPDSPMYLMESVCVIIIYAIVHDLHFKELDTFHVWFHIASMLFAMLTGIYAGMSSIVVYPLLVWVSLNN